MCKAKIFSHFAVIANFKYECSQFNFSSIGGISNYQHTKIPESYAYLNHFRLIHVFWKI